MNVVGLLRKKALRRIALLAVLVAPIIYLFGTQISALAGAHGEELLAETTQVTPSYKELMTPENFNYGAFNWKNENGKRLGFSLGNARVINPNGVAYFYCGIYGVGYESENDVFQNNGLGFISEEKDYLAFYYDNETIISDESYIVTMEENLYACFYTVVNNTEVRAGIYKANWDNGYSISYTFYNYDEYNQSWIVDDSNIVQYVQETYIYFDDGQNLPEGYEWNNELASYFVPTVKPVETTSYRNALFGNMFGQANFLTEWGQNALDDTAGLQPVNALLKFIAEDGLNIADTNIGLMGVGYATYLLHAVMIYEFVVLTIELLTIPLKIGDWFTKGVNKE